MASSTMSALSETASSIRSARLSMNEVSSWGSMSTYAVPRSVLSEILTAAPRSTSRMNSVTKFPFSWYLFLKSFSHGTSRMSTVGLSTVTVIPETETVDVPAPGFR